MSNQETTAVTIRFRLSKSDVFRALFRNTIRRIWVVTPVPAIGLLAIALAIADPRYRASLASGIFVFLFGAFLFAGRPYLQAVAAMRNPALRGPLVYTFSDSGIEAMSDHSSGRFDWIMVKSVSETKNYILILVVQGALYIVPKNQLIIEDTRALKNILRTFAPGKFKLRP